MAQQKAHCVILPWPIQGHINPMLQFGKRLVSKGAQITLLLTNSLAATKPLPPSAAVSVATYSDGFDTGIPRGVSHEDAALTLLRVAPNSVKDAVLRIIGDSGRNVDCIVYDSYLPWALDVAGDLGIPAGPFFTQSAAVSLIYYEVFAGKVGRRVPDDEGPISVPGLPPLEVRDLPSFLTGHVPFPTIFELAIEQFRGIQEKKADWLFINSFDDLEQEVLECMKKWEKVITVGPTVPSMYLDRRIPNDHGYGLNLYPPAMDACKEWLSHCSHGSVVYVSFGSVSSLSEAQVKELALGLQLSSKPFLWALRAPEQTKLPMDFSAGDTRLVVEWCPQLEVLAHPAVGCFVTHCGWNSTLEALSLGVPMVAVPQWTDQPTNAWCVVDVWKVGVRVEAEGEVVGREEIRRCVEEVMGMERGMEMRRNAEKWKEVAKGAIDEEGSSDRSIDDFLASFCNHIESSE